MQSCQCHKNIKMANLTQAQNTLITNLIQDGMSERAVPKRLNVSKSTVHYIKSKWQETQSIERRRVTGRPKVSSREEDNNLVEVLRENPFKTVVKARQESAFPGSTRSARRRIRQVSELRSRMAVKKPFLSNANKEDRVGFALQFYRELPQFWKNIIFTDEKVFQSCYNGRLRVYRPPNSRFEERYTQGVQNSGRFSVNVWGWMSGQGLGVCYFIQGQFITQVYLDILQQIMLPAVMQRFPNGNFIYQQDNCPVHSARRITEWMSQQNIKVLPWPSRSPDLNVMENVWGILVKQINGDNNFRPQNADELKQKIQEAWQGINPNYARAFIASMPR